MILGRGSPKVGNNLTNLYDVTNNLWGQKERFWSVNNKNHTVVNNATENPELSLSSLSRKYHKIFYNMKGQSKSM